MAAGSLSRRGLLTGAAGAAVGAGLTACAGTGYTGPDGGNSNTIDFWSNHPGKSKTTETKLIAAFEKAHPGLTVKLTDAGKDYVEVGQKFNAALAGGSKPDVVVLSDTTWFNFALNDRLADVGALMQRAGRDTADFVPTLYDDYRYGNEHFALPYARSTPLFYYNKTFWKKAGLPDRGPTSWDEFTRWAPALKKAVGPGKAPIILDDGSHYLDWTFQAIVWSYGGNYSKGWSPTFTDPGTVRAGHLLQQWSREGWLKTSADSQSDFEAGLGAVLMESTGDLSGILKDGKFELGVADLPSPGGRKACPTGGAGLAIPKDISTHRQRNALQFVDFMTSAANTVTFSQATGYMPSRRSAQNSPAQRAYLKKNPLFERAVLQLPKTRAQDRARVFVPGGATRIGQALDEIVAGSGVRSRLEQLNADTKRVYDAQVKSHLENGF